MPKPIYIFDMCDCVDEARGEVAIKGLVFRFQSKHAIYFYEICCVCGCVTKIREPLDDMDEIWDMQKEAEAYFDSEESKNLLEYIDEQPDA